MSGQLEGPNLCRRRDWTNRSTTSHRLQIEPEAFVGDELLIRQARLKPRRRDTRILIHRKSIAGPTELSGICLTWCVTVRVWSGNDKWHVGIAPYHRGGHRLSGGKRQQTHNILVHTPARQVGIQQPCKQQYTSLHSHQKERQPCSIGCAVLH